MEEMEESGGGAIGDWRALISSPRGVLWATGCGSDGGIALKSLSQILSGSDAAPTSDSEKVEDLSVSSAVKGEESGGFSGAVGSGFAADGSGDWMPPAGRNGGSIAERRAARCGFSAPKISTARFRSVSPLSSPSVRSPYLTIPPGLSPTALLDSPVMLPNSQAQPSPTTGTFPLPSMGLESTVPMSTLSNTDKDSGDNMDSSFVFKPHANPMDVQHFSAPENQLQNVDMPDVKHQALPPVQKQVEFECQAGFPKETMTKNYSPTGSPSEVEVSNNGIVKSNNIALQTSHSNVGSDQAHQHEEQLPVEDSGSQHILEGERGAYANMGTGRPSEDGYNWRKYGQKQVKGSEYPRSYYKCTHPNCQVKKKIERSHDGQITKIIHKGAHCHPKPQPSRRSALGSGFPLGEMPEPGEGPGPYVKVEGGSTWRSISQGSKDNRIGSEWRADGLERTSSTSVLTDLSDPLSTAHGKHLGALETADTPELSSTLASHDEDEDRATQGSVSIGDDGDDDESESKRRKKDSCLIETNLASRSVREPRVVVQTDSEVDILDDGYRWRKYGQKVVKGNPNPRSYYKCTSPGCSVRKHVERASHDLRFVITTYEGKHNHEVPAARSSSHVNSTGGVVPPATSNAQNTLTLPRNNIPKPEPQIQDLVPRFERKPEHVNEFFKPTNLGAFASDMKYGASACYDMKLPPFPTAMTCGSFGLNANHSETHPVPSTISQVVQEFPISLPMNLPLSAANLALNSFDFNTHGKAVGPSYFLGGQHSKESDMRFIRPKQEQIDDTVFESHLPVNHLANASPSVYHQMMGGFPM